MQSKEDLRLKDRVKQQAMKILKNKHKEEFDNLVYELTVEEEKNMRELEDYE